MGNQNPNVYGNPNGQDNGFNPYQQPLPPYQPDTNATEVIPNVYLGASSNAGSAPQSGNGSNAFSAPPVAGAPLNGFPQSYPNQAYGMPQPPQKQRSVWPWVAGAVALVLVLVGVGVGVFVGLNSGSNSSAASKSDSSSQKTTKTDDSKNNQSNQGAPSDNSDKNQSNSDNKSAGSDNNDNGNDNGNAGGTDNGNAGGTDNGNAGGTDNGNDNGNTSNKSSAGSASGCVAATERAKKLNDQFHYSKAILIYSLEKNGPDHFSDSDVQCALKKLNIDFKVNAAGIARGLKQKLKLKNDTIEEMLRAVKFTDAEVKYAMAHVNS